MAALKVFLASMIAVAWAFVFPACAQDTSKLKIAILYYGQKKDGGWTQSFDEARSDIEKSLEVKITYAENIPEETTKIISVAENFIKRGNTIIIGTAYGYSDAFKQLAEKYPKISFLNAGGTTTAPNLEQFYGRSYESHYLCGMIAAGTSKTGRLGFVAAHPLGVVNWTVNAFALGARMVKPDATVNVVFTGSWDDPVKERAAANALLDQGIDVLGENVSTAATLIAAQDRQMYGTGHHRDFSEFAPKAALCSSVWTWSRFLIPELREIAGGNWKAKTTEAFVGIKGGGNDVACCNKAVPGEVAERMKQEREAIIAGKQVFAGPIYDNAGKLRVTEGAVLPDAGLWTMDWFVKGVTAQK